MVVVVVFDINIENIVVIIIKFNIMYFGLLLNGLSSMWVKLIFSWYLVVVIVRKKLFKNSMIIGLVKVVMILVDFSKVLNLFVFLFN